MNIGVLGGGQLARMTALAGHEMAINVTSLVANFQEPAALVGKSIAGNFKDSTAIANLMFESDFVILENEFVPATEVAKAMEFASFDEDHFFPGLEGLANIQDKLLQREKLIAAGVPSPRAVVAEEAADIGFPCMLKSRFGGYDGKGTKRVDSESEYIRETKRWSKSPWLAEELVDFTQELSVMVVRMRDGRTFSFPTMITEQVDNVCDLVHPLLDHSLDNTARQIAIQAVEAVNAYGLCGVELFHHRGGTISVNEIAPRPHNSGHYTMNWGGTSQFAAHLTSAMGCLSKIEQGEPTCMANLLGQENANSYMYALAITLAEHPDAHIHWYGKADSKPGRKMGHLNVRGENCRERAIAARNTFYQAWTKQ